MRILIHDYSGHPFQVQLSRELARRGNAVLHLYNGSNPTTPKGAVSKRDGDGAPVTGQSFVPRAVFGAYVRHLLNEELKQPELGDRLDLVRGDVLAIEADAGHGLTLRPD